MSDIGARLRSVFQQIAPPIEIGAVMSATEPVTYRRRAWLMAAAAAGITVLVGVGAGLLIARRGTEPPVVTSPPAMTSTTGAPTPTTTLAGWGLDALAAFHARPVPPEATCPAGSTPDVPGDPEAPRPVEETLESDSSVAFDRQSGLLVEVLVNREPSGRFSHSTWTFDPCRNRWQEMQSIGFNPTWYLSPITYDADSDRIVTVDYLGTVWTYDTDADKWTSIAWAVGKTALPNQSPAVYDDASGLLVFYVTGPRRTPGWAYDVDTDLRYEITPWEAPAGELVYDPAGDRFYIFPWETMEVVRWEPGEGWQSLGIPAPEALFTAPECGLFDLDGGPVAVDEATGRIEFFCKGKAVAAFDPATRAWETLDESGPDSSRFRANTAVYDSANGRLILVGGWYEGTGGAMWAYDGRTGEWTELLAAAG